MFSIYEREDGKWDWRLLAANGEKVATSGGQGFRDRFDAKRGMVDFLGVIWQMTVDSALLTTRLGDETETTSIADPAVLPDASAIIAAVPDD